MGEIARANRARLKGKKPKSRGEFITQTLDMLERQRIQAERTEDAHWLGANGHTKTFIPGDILRVTFQPTKSEPEQKFVGICIAKHRKGLATSFRVVGKVGQSARKQTQIEYQFMHFSPLLKDVQVLVKQRDTGRLRRSKLYFLRDKLSDVRFPKSKTKVKVLRKGGGAWTKRRAEEAAG